MAIYHHGTKIFTFYIFRFRQNHGQNQRQNRRQNPPLSYIEYYYNDYNLRIKIKIK